MIMSKPFVILVLIAMQLLSGSGSSVYLCIGADGSLDIHSGLNSCKCCKADGNTDRQCCGRDISAHQHSSCAASRKKCTTHVASKATATCDCTHIPIARASNQPSGVTRTFVELDRQRVSSLVILPGHVNCDRQLVSRSMMYAVDKAVDDFSLAMVTLVVIRC